jgi:CBS-domain-containing membrane protein
MARGGTMSGLTAKDIMTRDVIRVHQDWSLTELAAAFTDHMITGAPVVDDTKRLVGVVSTTDLARQGNNRSVRATVPPDFYVRGWDLVGDDARGFSVDEDSELRVRDIMTPMIFSVSLDASLEEMADTMIGGRVHRLIVTNGDEVMGIVTTLDMLKALREQRRTEPVSE